jgi:predicted lipoprotein with Yx(FWY)xxD motif
MNKVWLVPAGLAAAFVIGACGSSSSSTSSGGGASSATPASSAPAAGSSALKTAKIGGATVVTTFWPPVKGPATAGAGVTGKLATITRADGSVQATYNGHPLYTYVGDHAPGQATGNGLNVNGGVWHEVTVSVAAA